MSGFSVVGPAGSVVLHRIVTTKAIGHPKLDEAVLERVLIDKSLPIDFEREDQPDGRNEFHRLTC